MSREIARAIYKGDIDKFDFYIQSGVGVNTLTEVEKWNFLHRALMPISLTVSSDMVKHLIDCGVNVNAIDYYGNTPLHYAARLGDSKLLKLLLDNGAAVDAENLEGVTPLRELLLKKPVNLEAIDMLLSCGANMNHKAEGGKTVKEYAQIIAHGDNTRILDVFNKYDSPM